MIFFPLVPIGGTFPLFNRFLTNIVLLGLTDVIFPMPSTSVDAGAALSQLGVLADLVYVDASHEEYDVSRDLETYWPLVRPGGVLFGDDYQVEWPGVMAAVDGLVAAHQLGCEVFDNKYVISKPVTVDS
jgi:predicted O-methyltransferase YrrM